MTKKKKRRLKKVKLDESGRFYGYLKTGRYVREDLGRTRKGCVAYRVKEIKKGVKLLICIKKKEGKRGGKTKALAILRDVGVDLRRYRKKGKEEVYRAIKKARKLKKKQTKKDG